MNPSLLEIPGYSLHSRLGSGAMAEVYLATQQSLQRKVAIKVLRSNADQGFAERFVREAHILASLRHPAIITIHDIGRLADGRPYLAMEYLSGGDLAQFRGQVFEPARALEIVRQVASGLAVVHASGLVHRDIKPANILLREDGSVVISDFGVAKALEVDSDMTHAGIAVGSPAYSSPEQVRCLPLDARSDIYSLGVTLLELLTGNNPFRAANPTESLMRHLQLELPPLPEALQAYQALLDGMLARDPQARFGDCQALLAALVECGAQDPDATQLRAAPMAAPAVRRRPARPLLIGAGVLLVLLGVAFASHLGLQRQRLAESLSLAQERLLQGQLLSPAGDSAEHHFRQALRLDPDNPQALAGLERILQARIDGYLQLAAQRLAEDKLLLPEDDGAVFYYRQVLGWAPDDGRALAGLTQVAQRYADMSEAAYARYDYTQALELIERGLEVEPDNPGLLLRQQEHAQRVAAFEAARQQAQPRPVRQARQVRNSVKQFLNDVFR
jgi:tRNA A-37 threonylcarbamoyl transferase component Bud32/tetratricopeptide (TPR) repeat protein